VPFGATPNVVDSPVEMVSAANGDASPLRFANVDADIRGADAGSRPLASKPMKGPKESATSRSGPFMNQQSLSAFI
jgi:hypothetical protein